jgi:hypothetical protein
VYDVVNSDPEAYGEGYATPLIASQPDDKEDRSPLNCFLRFLNVTTDGKYTCGLLVEKGKDTHVDWQAGNCSLITNLGTALATEAKSAGYTSLLQITTGQSQKYFMHYFVVSGEYAVLGADDKDNTDKLMKWIPGSGDMGTFNPINNRTEMHFVLARAIDLGGTVVQKRNCKTAVLVGIAATPGGSDMTYDKYVKLAGYEGCEYNLHNGGKFYDSPGFYISTFSISRLGANRGEVYYK